LGEKLKVKQDSILNSYDLILYHMKDTEAGLYGHQAGYNKDKDLLDDDVAQAKKLLSHLIQGYSVYGSQEACDFCHSVEETGSSIKKFGKVPYHKQELKNILDRITAYDEKIRRVVALGRGEGTRPFVDEVIRDGKEIVDSIHRQRSAMLGMDERIKELYLAELHRSLYSIVLAIVASITLSSVIVIFMIRSLTGPVNMLVHGMKEVSSGDFSQRVSVRADDEIGFLAKNFNTMTDSLNKVTMQKETLLEELRNLNATLEQRVHEATEQLKMAHEKMLRSETLSAVGTFASGVAHELATPLSSVLSYFQTVKRSIPSEARLAEDTAIIEKELTRCIRILRGMLDFARTPEAEKTATNINAIISELLALVRYQTEYKKVNIIEELGEDVPDILAIPGQLKQVFLNIILNGLQSMPGGGELTVSTFTTGEGEGRRVAMRVSDTGEGIADDEINKIFQPFYTTKKSGTGLGLAISYGIIRGHGGDIEVKNNAGKGTTFSVYLPVSLHASSDDAPTKGPAGLGQI